MAASYLDVQKHIEDMRNYNKELEDQLEVSELEMKKVAEETDSEEAKKFVQLQKEKVDMKKFLVCVDFFWKISHLYTFEKIHQLFGLLHRGGKFGEPDGSSIFGKCSTISKYVR